MWAVSDPFWGEPYLLPTTFRESALGAMQAFLRDPDFGISHGGSQFPLPDGTRGDWDCAYKHGFRVVKIEIDGPAIKITEQR